MGAWKSQINNFFWYGPQRYEVKLPMYLTVPQCYNDTVFLCQSNLQFWFIIDNRNHKYHQTDNMAVLWRFLCSFVRFWAVFEQIGAFFSDLLVFQSFIPTKPANLVSY